MFTRLSGRLRGSLLVAKVTHIRCSCHQAANGWLVSSHCEDDTAVRGSRSAAEATLRGSRNSPTARRRLLQRLRWRSEGDRLQRMSSQWSGAFGQSLHDVRNGLVTVC
jgi:hypothetical protein